MSTDIQVTTDKDQNDILIVTEKMGKIPNITTIHSIIDHDKFIEILEKLGKYSIMQKNSEVIPFSDDIIINENTLININNFYLTYYLDDFAGKINGVKIFYDEKSDVTDIINHFTDTEQDEEIEISKDNILVMRDNILNLDNMFYDIDKDTFDIFYNTETSKSIKKLRKNIDNKKNKITIFCGDRGLGKTNATKFVINNTDRVSIFIPNNLVDHSINNPDFMTLATRYGKVLLIIDDVEFLTNSQFSKMNYFTSNLIQLTESLMSEQWDIHILLVFNTQKNMIDQNLLDCNSLENVIEFSPLTTEQANELRDHLNLKQGKQGGRLRDVIRNKKIKKNKVGL